MGVVDSGIRAQWAAVSADPERARQLASARAERARPVTSAAPPWMAPAPAAGAPGWLGPRGTGGHQATAAERRHVYAMFAARRTAVEGQPGRAGVFASMRDPGEPSPLCQRIFGIRG